MPLPAVPGGDRAAVSPPFPGPPVDPDDPARLRIAKALRDQPRELLTLLRLRQGARSPPPHRNPRTHRVLRRPLDTAEEPWGQIRLTKPRRGLFTVAPHASDIITWAGNYGARHVADKAASTPLMVRLSQALQRHLAEVEVMTAVDARTAVQEHGVPSDGDLLVVDGPLRGRQHLPRALGYIKSHRSTTCRRS